MSDLLSDIRLKAVGSHFKNFWTWETLKLLVSVVKNSMRWHDQNWYFHWFRYCLCAILSLRYSQIQNSEWKIYPCQLLLRQWLVVYYFLPIIDLLLSSQKITEACYNILSKNYRFVSLYYFLIYRKSKRRSTFPFSKVSEPPTNQSSRRLMTRRTKTVIRRWVPLLFTLLIFSNTIIHIQSHPNYFWVRHFNIYVSYYT